MKCFFKNKSFLTNIIALFVLSLSFYLPCYKDYLFNIGVFAFSGSITNWIAVYMLFEKVPFLYGSGIVPSRFQEFKTGIKDLIMREFFSEQNIKSFSEKNNIIELLAKDFLKHLNYKKLFEALVEFIHESKFAGMLAMFGGDSLIYSMEESFTIKIQAKLLELVNSDDFKQLLKEANHDKHIKTHVEQILDNRLKELTPQMVKEIVYDIIGIHLGWLVVWGGVFGGLIGFISQLIKKIY